MFSLSQACPVSIRNIATFQINRKWKHLLYKNNCHANDSTKRLRSVVVVDVVGSKKYLAISHTFTRYG